MMKIKRALFVLLMWAGFALAAFGQSTTVSGTVTDVSSQTWNNGTYAFQFVPNPQYPASTYTWTGGAFNQNAQITGSLNGSGAYSVSIPSNANISPINSQWKVTFCPQATATCYTTTGVTIFGGTQTLNATPPSITVTAQSNVLPIAYADTEITGAIAGSAYYNVTLASVRVCSALPCSSNWTSSGGGASPGSITKTYNLSPNCGGATNCTTINADAQVIPDATTTLNNSTITCPNSDCNFTAADVGKSAWVTTTGSPSYQYTTYVCPISTIATVNSAQSITLTAVNACTGTAQTATGVLIWGHKDGTAVAAAITAAGCSAINAPSGAILIDQPFGNTAATSTTCNLKQLVSTISVPVPFLQGIPDSTILIITPDFNYAGCTGTGGVNGVCIGSQMGGIVDTIIWGTGLTSATNANCPSSAKSFISLLPGSGDFNAFNVSGVCPGSPGNAVEMNSLDEQWYEGGAQESFTNACVGRSASSQTYQLDCLNSAIGGSSQGWVQLSGINQDIGTYLIGGLTISSGATYQSHGAHFIGVGSTGNAITCSGNLLEDGDFVNVDQNAANGLIMSSGCKVASRNTTYTNNNAGGAVISNVAATFLDQGGNTAAGTAGVATSTGVWRGDQVLTGSCSGVATSSATLGLYGLGQFSTPACTSTTVNAGTVMSTTGTGLGLYVTATTGGFSASSGVVTVLKNGVATAETCTIGTGTSCHDATQSHEFAYAVGDVISIQFTTQATETLAGVKATMLAW